MEFFSHQIWDFHLKQAHSGSHHFAFCHHIPRNERSHDNNLHSRHTWIFVSLMGKSNPSFVLWLSSWPLLMPCISVTYFHFAIFNNNKEKKMCWIELKRKKKSWIERSGNLVFQLWLVWNSVGIACHFWSFPIWPRAHCATRRCSFWLCLHIRWVFFSKCSHQSKWHVSKVVYSNHRLFRTKNALDLLMKNYLPGKED